jgi:hypothetical protein
VSRYQAYAEYKEEGAYNGGGMDQYIVKVVKNEHNVN